MPRPDLVPSPPQSTMRRFLRVLGPLALFSIVTAAGAVFLVTRGEGEIRASLIVATALGVGLSVLLGTGLMALMFISSGSGHDEQARIHSEDDKE